MSGLQPKELFVSIDQDQFKFICVIGKGSFGEVHKCIHAPSGLTVAIKTIDLEKAEDEIDEIRKEISFHGHCEHPNITTYYSSRIVKTKLWILMEYLGGGSVLDLLKLNVMEEVYIATITREALKGLAYLHDQKKIHRDIKCANILLSEIGEVKLADFGVAGELTDTLRGRDTFVGTPFWMAPEVIIQSKYDSKADIWSIGITLFEMSNGHPPHHELHPMKALFAITKDNPPELKASHSKYFKEFSSMCLQKDPEHRATAKVLLKHKFLKLAKKTAILIDLIVKLKLRKSAYTNVLSEVNDIKHAEAEIEESPNWMFETLRVAKKVETISLPALKNDSFPIKIDQMDMICNHTESSSYTQPHESKSHNSIIKRKDNNFLRPFNKEKKTSNKLNYGTHFSSDVERRKSNKFLKHSKKLLNGSYLKVDKLLNDNHKISQTVSLFTYSLERVVKANNLNSDAVSEFMAKFTDKTRFLAQFYAATVKLIYDTKQFNNSTKK